jgi:hypothetical protein
MCTTSYLGGHIATRRSDLALKVELFDRQNVNKSNLANLPPSLNTTRFSLLNDGFIFYVLSSLSLLRALTQSNLSIPAFATDTVRFIQIKNPGFLFVIQRFLNKFTHIHNFHNLIVFYKSQPHNYTYKHKRHVMQDATSPYKSHYRK